MSGLLDRSSSSAHCARSDVGATIRVADGPLRCCGGGFGATRKALLSRSCFALDEPAVSVSMKASGSRAVWMSEEIMIVLPMPTGRIVRLYGRRSDENTHSLLRTQIHGHRFVNTTRRSDKRNLPSLNINVCQRSALRNSSDYSRKNAAFTFPLGLREF